MTECIKYLENGRKNMSFVIKDDMCLQKYNEIWDKIKETLNIKFHSIPVCDEQYIKAKVRENEHYTCIVCITTDSVMKMEKKNYLQVYLEEYKYRMKKAKMTKFIND